MKHRILLKEIPANKFHSAILTTYSVSLYYLEQQVLSALSSKGVHYISILADYHMLDTQLANYIGFNEHRRRDYALHGIQCKGAFHPKLIFLAGETAVLLLIGSGNLTSSGHGKNLEVWSAVYVEDGADEKLGFVIEAWSYLKKLHSDLGIAAERKLKTIEASCPLLNETGQDKLKDWYEADGHTKIRFISTNETTSIFQQLLTAVGDENIENITVMSPYYDTEGQLLQQLNEQFQPEGMNVIYQEDFGVGPSRMRSIPNLQFYNWETVYESDPKQPYFHAKNLVLQGKSKSFLLAGSANASVAAFGSGNHNSVNEEACILYQSDKANFIKQLGIQLKAPVAHPKFALTYQGIQEGVTSQVLKRVFIRTAEQEDDLILITVVSSIPLTGVVLTFFNQKGEIIFENEMDLQAGNMALEYKGNRKIVPFYCEVYQEKQSISNKQFVIDSKAFETTNPSPQNRSLNHLRKLIESGVFSTPKIVDYLSTVYYQSEQTSNEVKTGSARDAVASKNWEELDLLYMSYEEVQEKIKELNQYRKEKTLVEYKSVRLWDIIFSYLKERRERDTQQNIDEEETEDVNKSTGRNSTEQKKNESKIVSSPENSTF